MKNMHTNKVGIT